MLVRLTSNTSGEMIMFAEHAHALFGWMGKESTARGVFTREQLPEAIARLHQGVEEEKLARHLAEEKRAESVHGQHEESVEEVEEVEGEHPEEHVTLGQRAQPLIHLMEWTLKEGGFIIWEAAEDF